MPDLVFFSDLKAVLETAKKLKQKEVIIAQRFSGGKELSDFVQKSKKEKLAIKFCHLLGKPDEKLDSEIESLSDFFGCVGGTVSANKNAVASKRIDFLFQPVGTQRFEFDSALANTARDNNVSIAVSFSDFLDASQRDLVSLFRNYFLLSKICRRAGAKIVIFSGANNANGMRAQADLESFLALLQQNNFSEEDLEGKIK